MPTIDATNAAIGKAKDDMLKTLTDLLTSNASAGDKSAALLKAQADAGIVDGTMNLLSKTYNKFGQIGQ